jgi:hypothetical protein
VLTYITVSSEVLQKLDLSQGTLGQNLLAEDIGDLLDRNALIGLAIGRSTVENKVSVCLEQKAYVMIYQTIP